MTRRRKRGGSLIGLAAMAAAAPAVAQVTGMPSPTPTASPTAAAPLPIPPAPVILLPTPTPTPSTTPIATPTPPRPAPIKRPAAAAEPTATPSPRGSASPSSGSPTATPAPTATPSVAAPVIAAPATPLPSAVPIAVTDDGYSLLWPIAAVIGGVAVLGLGALLLRRRRAADEDEVEAIAEPPSPAPVAAARLTMTFRPIRAGLNLLSAISENEVVLANIGDAPAEDIRVATHLASAHTGQDADLAAIRSAPIDRPAIPAFALAPGEQRAVTGVAVLPREAIHALTAAGRPMFVPLVAVDVAYATAGVERRLSQAFAVGIERVDSAKLAPFWLDVPARTVETVAARPHGVAVEG